MFKFIVHNKRKYNPLVHSFTVVNINGNYMFQLHKLASFGCIYQKYKKEISLHRVMNGQWTRSRPYI